MKSSINDEFWVICPAGWRGVTLDLDIYIELWLSSPPSIMNRELSCGALGDFLTLQENGYLKVVHLSNVEEMLLCA